MESVSVHLAVLAIGGPASGTPATVEAVGERVASAGHRIVARGTVPDDELAIREQLAHWISDPEIDVVIVTGDVESTTVAAALAPLVSQRLQGFTDLFRFLAFENVGAGAMMSNAEAARCDTTYVFVLPAVVGAVRAAMDKLILPQLDPSTLPQNLVTSFPRLQTSDDAVPASISPEKTASGAGVMPKMPALPRVNRTTGANVISRVDPFKDEATRPIDLDRLQREIASSEAQALDFPTRPDLDLRKLPRVPPGADPSEHDLETISDDTIETLAAPPPPARPRTPTGREPMTIPRITKPATIATPPTGTSTTVLPLRMRPAPASAPPSTAFDPSRPKPTTVDPARARTPAVPSPVVPVRSKQPTPAMPSSVVGSRVPRMATPATPNPIVPVRAARPNSQPPPSPPPRAARTSDVGAGAARIPAPSEEVPTVAAARVSAPSVDPFASTLRAPRASTTPDARSPTLDGSGELLEPDALTEVVEGSPATDAIAAQVNGATARPAAAASESANTLARAATPVAPEAEALKVASPIVPEDAKPPVARTRKKPESTLQVRSKTSTPRARSAPAEGLPRGNFAYPVHKKRGSLALKLVFAALALGGGFVLVLVLLSNYAGTKAQSPIDGAVAIVVPVDTAEAAPPIDAEQVAAVEPAPVDAEELTEQIEMPAGVDATPTPTPVPKSPTPPKPPTTPTTRPAPDAGTPTAAGPVTTPTTAPLDAAPAPVVVKPSDPSCDEVSCVLEKYARPCCERYRPKTDEFRPHAGTPDALDKTLVRQAVDRIKPRIIKCGEQSGVKGTVKLALVVNGDGKVTDASVVETPDAALGDCVATAMRAAKFAETTNGGSFTYPFAF